MTAFALVFYTLDFSIIFYLQSSAGFDGIDVEADNSNGDLLASRYSLW
jgi:hypothetical protein